jgi:hypothetical protein
MIYYFLSIISHASKKKKGVQFMGPALFLMPSFLDKEGKRLRRNALYYLVVSLSLFGLFVFIGENWPR